MRGIIVLAITGAVVCVAAPARADVKYYCEGYARNEANMRLSGSSILGPGVKPTAEEWAARNKQALADCMARYEPKLELLARKSSAPVSSTKTTTKTTATTKLVVGSAAWNDYCDKKYASFDRATGTYTSRTGKRRPCLVPKN